MSSRTALLLSALATLPACAPGLRGGPAAALPDGGERAARLQAVIDSVIATPPLDRTHWGIEIRHADGTPVLRLDADKLFTAASNAKLATMIAALDLLGPEYRFRTGVRATGADGVADALVVRGSGDPSLSLAALDSLADSLALAGLRRVQGPLVVDASRFDSVLVHPAWENFDLDWYYAAPVAPFAVMEAAIPVVVTPARVGAAARVDVLAPPGLVRVDASILTVEGDDGWDDDLERAAGVDAIVMRGTIGAAAGPDTSWIAQDDPGRLAGRALVRALEARGIPVAGPVVVAYTGPSLEGWDEAPGLAVDWSSPPLSAILPVALEQSDNWVTEMVLRTVGAEVAGDGGWSASTAAVEAHLAERAGVDPAAMYLRDGSGLTQQTLFSPAALVALLRYAAGRPWGALFRRSLAAPGESESTLDDRLLPFAGRVEAKTGTIRHVNSLSGYARGTDGQDLVFSILSNNSGRPASEVQRAIDRILAAMIQGGT